MACQPFKVYLEELVQQERMDRQIDWTKSPDVRLQPRGRILDSVVQCIHGLMDRGWAAELHRELCLPPSEVMMIHPSSKRKMDARQTWEITFTEQDMQGVSFPHNDALVISVTFQWKMVCRVLID